MKKISVIICCLFMIFAVSGCDKDKNELNVKTLTCTGKSLGNNMNAESSVKYTFKNDKLSNANIKFMFKDIKIDNLSSVWDNLKEQFTEQNKPAEDIGYRRTVEADDKNYVFTVFVDIDFRKISKETMEKYEVEDYREKTYDELKEEAKELSLTCK